MNGGVRGVARLIASVISSAHAAQGFLQPSCWWLSSTWRSSCISPGAAAPLRERAIWRAEARLSLRGRIAFVWRVAREPSGGLLVVGYLIGAFVTMY